MRKMQMAKKMNIEHYWHTFNIAEAIAAFIPFKSKKYVKKLGKVCPDDIHKIFIEHDCQDNRHRESDRQIEQIQLQCLENHTDGFGTAEQIPEIIQSVPRASPDAPGHGIFFEGSQKEWGRISMASGNEALESDNISFNTTIEKREEYIYKDLCVALFFIIAVLVIALFFCILRITGQKNEILRLTGVIEKLKNKKVSAKPANKPK